jgi:Zn-dependent protease with chaperone function
MRFFQTEYLLKGIFLGLVLDAALLLAALPLSATWRQGLACFAACTFGGLAVTLFIAAVLKFARASESTAD